MENENEEFEESSELISNNSNDTESDENTTPEQKNKSNWKKMAEKLKTLEKTLADERAEKEELKKWANSLYENPEDQPFTKKEATQQIQLNESLDDVVTFYQKNPEALEHKDLIIQAMNDFKCDRNKAWKFVKSDMPEESKTKKDFDLQKWKPNLKKDLSKITAEESLDLSKEERSQWRKLNWWA